MDRGFGGYHPLINFIFFIAAVVFGMFFVHPVFTAVCVIFSLIYYFTIKGKGGIRFAAGMLLLAVLLTAINPIFNTLGDTVLFTYLGGRRYTLEALIYGACSAGMFFGVIIWFSCYNENMTSDKFIYIFGRIIPAVSLVLTMVLRLVPDFKRRTTAIEGARGSIGKGGGDKKTRLKNSTSILSALTSWALEGAVTTADSMRSRGYGLSGRTSFAIYRMKGRDHAALIVMMICIVGVIVCAALGGTAAQFIPSIEISPFSLVTATGAAAYAILLAIPSAIHFWEELTWRILRSRI